MKKTVKILIYRLLSFCWRKLKIKSLFYKLHLHHIPVGHEVRYLQSLYKEELAQAQEAVKKIEQVQEQAQKAVKKVEQTQEELKKIEGVFQSVPTPTPQQENNSEQLIKISTLTQSGNYDGIPRKRNVILFRNSYYHFYYLAQALRRRNWDVVTVSFEDPKSKNSLYYHGEDINLYSPYSDIMISNLDNFFTYAKEKYDLFHIANDFGLSFFPYHYHHDAPQDIIEWKRLGKKIAYTISGCLSMTKQSSVAEWSRKHNGRSVCDSCRWQDMPEVCCDDKNDEWGRKVSKYVDIVFAEALPAIDYIDRPNVIREPTTMCLDPIVWHPELDVPESFKLTKKHKEIFIYHAVGNYKERSNDKGKNIKGTPAVIAAVEKLQDEGYPVRLIFVTDQMNRDVRFTQIQADIIVDQLNYGRYGATAREGMMLGKPVVHYINPVEMKPEHQLKSLQECPLVQADEYTVYAVLKDLIDHKDKREAIGRAGREYALKWHSADACALRYEKIYDTFMNDGKLIYPDSWRYFEPRVNNVSL